MIYLIIGFALLCAFVYAPKATAAIGVALVTMFLYVWIYDPPCQNYARHHPEWGGECGVHFR